MRRRAASRNPRSAVAFPQCSRPAVLPDGMMTDESMSESETERAFEELDRLLNDPEVRMDAARVWALLDGITSSRRMLPLPTA